MRLKDLVTVGLRQVIRQRRRFQGVVLVVAFGVASIVTILTMSREIKKNINEDLDLIGGVTVLRVYFDNDQNGPHRQRWFRETTVAALARVPGVRVLSLGAVKWGQANRHGEQYGFSLIAVDHRFWQVLNLTPLNGGVFTADTVAARQRQCVLGEQLAKKIFGTTQATGQTLKINQELYSISGVLRGVPMDSGLDYTAFIPLTTARDRLPGTFYTDRLYVRCETWDDIPQVAAAIPQIIKSHQSSEKLHVNVGWECLSRLQQLTWWVEFLVYLAVGIIFLLGGAGIWNVMMAAVNTRVREIGLKKAMGAEDRDILVEFLFEAICLSLIGALLGAALGRLAIEILAYFTGSHLSENLFLLSLSLGFMLAAILGAGAGLYPSLRASRMEVVSAIRYE